MTPPLRHVDVRVFDETPVSRVTLPQTVQGYAEVWQAIEALHKAGDYATYQAAIRTWVLASNYFLLRYVMDPGRHAFDAFRHCKHFDHEVHIEIADRIQFDPEINNTVLVGYRGLGKSSHLDADDIRDVLVDPNYAIFYFSLTKDLAQKHLQVIMSEFEKNRILIECFPDRVWASAEERSNAAGRVPWSTSAICIKRESSRPEQTIEAHAFEHALPTGMHPDKRRYDDIEADRAVSSNLTAATIEERWRSSQDLTSSVRARRVTGTYYSASALMVKLSSDFGMKVARYPGEDTLDPVPPAEAGPLGGRCINGLTREHAWHRLADKGGAERADDGTWRRTTNEVASVEYARQTACDPIAGEARRLDWGWIKLYDGDPKTYATKGTVIVCADCSTGAKDPTWVWVWLLTPEREFWWLDAERKVVQPLERRKLLHEVVQRWINYGATIPQLRLEQFGQATYVQDQEEFWRDMPAFPAPRVVKCNDNRSPGMGEGKIWSIYERWQPQAAAGRVYFPRLPLWREDERGVKHDLVAYFKQWEFGLFPKPRTDNGLDAGKLIWEDEKRVGPMPWPEAVRDHRMKPPQRRINYQSAGVM